MAEFGILVLYQENVEAGKGLDSYSTAMVCWSSPG